ncbi:MAG: hypothetical protein HQL27_04190 [Candidatus Omnitrophica bacterium]|nr:hypothetical protein [Candidatus Omnitrophota bacterium]
MEAVWLYENNFNFHKLAFEMFGFEQGGPRVYFFSLYPSFLALMMYFIKNSQVYLLINHLFVIFAGALSLLFVYKIATMVCSKKTSLFSVLLFVFNPLFLSQISVIGMDIIVMLFGLMGVYYFLKEEHSASMLMFLIGFCIKPSCIVFSAAAVLASLLSEKELKNKITRAFAYSIPVWLYFLEVKIAQAFFFNPEHLAPLLEKTSLSTMINLLKTYLFLIPDIYLVLVFILLCFAVFICRGLKNHPAKEFMAENKAIVFFAALLGEVFILTFVFWGFLPRYFIIVLPFLVIGLLWGAEKISARSVPFVVLAALGFSLINMQGLVYDLIKVYRGNNGHYLERTLAFEDDMENNLSLVKLLEDKYKGKTIITSWPLLHMLASPQFFYTKEKWSMISSDYQAFAWRGVRKLRDIDFTDKNYIDKLIWVWANNCYAQHTKPDLNRETILDVVQKGSLKVYVYKKP